MSLIHNSGGSRGWARGPGPAPLIFRPNWGPKSRKNIFGTPSLPLISGSGWPPPPFIWRSGSAAAYTHTLRIASIELHSFDSFLPSFSPPLSRSLYLYGFIYFYVLSTSQTKNKLSTVTRLKLPMQASLKKFLVRWILTMSPSRFMGLGRHPWRQTLKGEAPKLSFSIPGHMIHVLGLNARKKTEARELRNEFLCSWRKLAPFFHFTQEKKNEIEKTNGDDDYY